MRIKKLELHNIASIEDAVIDFDASPLSDTDLFLITGTTGAGKTTILDGISLALYNTTPRISKGIKNSEHANADDLTGHDPRNIVRQNTGYAFSRLHFTGNDGKDYCAEWSVQRGTYKKVNVSLNNAVWSITDVKTGKCLSGRVQKQYEEVESEIIRVIGLDFNQFCRTTMLAQGEFTEFLKSKPEDKAAILEKISGSDIYRKIGAEIFNQKKEADERFREEDRNNKQIVTLPEAQRKAKEEQLKNIDTSLSAIQKKIDVLQECIDWLNKETSLKIKTADAKLALEKDEEKVKAEEFLNVETDVKQWNETIEVRQSHKNAANESTKAEAADAALTRLESTFRDVLDGEAYLSEDQAKLTEKVTALEGMIKEQSDNVSAYENSVAVIADIRKTVKLQGEIEKKKAEKKVCEETAVPQAQQRLEESCTKLSVAVGNLDASGKELEKVTAELAALNLNGLREKKEFLQKVEGLKGDIDKYKEQINAAKKDVDGYEVEFKSLKAAAEAETAELERLKQEHERRSETIHEFAKLMRTKLNEHLGQADNTCPVCGQHVSALQSDSVLDQEFAKIKKEYEEQEKKVSAAGASVAAKAGLITATMKRIDGIVNDLGRSEKELDRYIAGRDDAEQLLAASKNDLSAMISAVSEQIAQGVKIEERKTQIQDAYNNLLKTKGEAEKQHLRCENELKTAQKSLEGLISVIDEKGHEVKELSGYVKDALEGSSGWDADWKQSPDLFISELTMKAKTYSSYVTEKDAAEKKILANEPVLSSIKTIKDEVMKAMPAWKYDNVVPVQIDGLQDKWVRLNADVKSFLQSLKSASDERERYEGEVKAFLEAHVEYSIERLAELDAISSEKNTENARYVNQLRNSVANDKEKLEDANKDLSDHLTMKPEALNDEDTSEALASDKMELESQRDQFNVEKGSLETELKNDDEQIKKKGDTTLLDKLRQEKEKWERFCSVFGSADGSTLSKIAQSFVLESLLHSANHHLQSMAPRYRLLVNPGSLNLKLEDQYNGYATRSTNSISGGESFLVSLALALALADFGQHLGVSTLFIDEGFGTLSGEALQSAINTLKALHSNSGRQVGIISHREEIRENIPVQIKVNSSAGGSASTIDIGVSHCRIL